MQERQDIADPLGVRGASILGSVVEVAGFLAMIRYPGTGQRGTPNTTTASF
jgi:hypothetical protein